MREAIVAFEGRILLVVSFGEVVERDCFLVVDGSGRKGWGHSTGARLATRERDE